MEWGRCMLSNLGRQLTIHRDGECPAEPNELECAVKLRCGCWVTSTPLGLAKRICEYEGIPYNDTYYSNGQLISKDAKESPYKKRY